MDDISLDETISMDVSNCISCSELLEHYKVVTLSLYKAHKNRANFNSYMSVFYNITIIILTSITGSASLSLLFEEYKTLKVLNVILSYIVVVLGMLYRYLTPDKRIQTHRFAAEEYIRLYYTIVEELVFCEVRITFIKQVNKRLEELRQFSPYINDDLYDKYKVICSSVYNKHKKITNLV